jgi:hypothetical protein
MDLAKNGGCMETEAMAGEVSALAPFQEGENGSSQP